MNQSLLPRVIDRNGVEGRLETKPDGALVSDGRMVVRLVDGRQIYVTSEMLRAQQDGSFLLPFSLDDMEQVSGHQTRREGESIVIPEGESIVIPLVAEELQVEMRTVETGRVRFHKTVQEQEQVVDEPLLREEVTVERVPINRFCEGPAPEVRQEGDILIIPVVEEVLVVEKRLVLKEELHVRREQSTFHAPQRVVLRHEEVSVEHIPLPLNSENVTI